MKKGVHILSNFFMEPRNKHLILSSFIWLRTSFIHIACDGEAGDFHLSKIKRLANRVTNAMKAFSEVESDISGGTTPNSAVSACNSTGLSFLFYIIEFHSIIAKN